MRKYWWIALAAAAAVALACDGGGVADPTEGPSMDSCGNVVTDGAMQAAPGTDHYTESPSDESS